jgi:hypothetical protein
MYKIIGSDQKEYGPISADQLRQWIAEGRINAQTLIQSETDPSWRPLSSFPEFAASAPPAAPFMPPLGGMDTQARASSLVSGPAIALIVTAAIGIALALLGMVMTLAGVNRTQVQGMDPEAARMVQMFQGPAALASQGIGIVVGVIIILGAMKMKKLESYGFAMTASVIAMIPCVSPCCILGLPFGIWALVVLNKPEVKSSFT